MKLYLITGGSASGKSAFAGRLAEQIDGSIGNGILYIATLADQSEESRKKVERHRTLRSGGCYRVEECFSIKDLRSVCSEANGKKDRKEKGYSAVLFDSLDGFTADVMFLREKTEGMENGKPDPEQAAQETVRAILSLCDVTDCLIVVSDQIYSDGIRYDEMTQRYLDYTSAAERILAEKSDAAVEVICGIPVLLKGDIDEFSEIAGDHVVTIYKNSDALS